MIKIKAFTFTDRYQFEKMIKDAYLEKKLIPPDSQKFIETIGFYTTFSNAGKIYMIMYNNNYIGYAIVINQWKLFNGGISLKIDELFIYKNYRKHKAEINLIEQLIKENKIYGIEINVNNLITFSSNIFKFFKFEKDKNATYIKKID